jgi:hypothetical protein
MVLSGTTNIIIDVIGELVAIPVTAIRAVTSVQ